MTVAFETFEEADDVRDPDHEVVCGVRMDDGSARYFVLDADCPDDVGHDVAFAIRHGRQPTSYEAWLKRVAEDMRAREMQDA
jgi:hypothetical protein